MAYADSRNQRQYIQPEATWGVIPNSTGTATVATGDAFLVTSLDMNDAQVIEPQPDKTGNLGRIVGQALRKSATWSLSMALRGSGSPGTAPDAGYLYQMILGKAAVVSAGVSVAYGADDNNFSAALWDFVTPSGVDQRVISGAIAQQMQLSIGQNYATVSFSGEGKAVVRKDNFSNYDSTGKSGLTAFPSEPASQTVSGTAIPGHRGTITLDGQTYTTFRSSTITAAVARELPKDAWNNDYPIDPSAGERTVSFDMSLYDDDSANFLSLKNKATNNTTVDVSFVVGVVAGNILTVSLNDVLLPKPSYDYSLTRRVVNFSGCQAHMSSISGKDDIGLVWT